MRFVRAAPERSGGGGGVCVAGGGAVFLVGVCLRHNLPLLLLLLLLVRGGSRPRTPRDALVLPASVYAIAASRRTQLSAGPAAQVPVSVGPGARRVQRPRPVRLRQRPLRVLRRLLVLLVQWRRAGGLRPGGQRQRGGHLPGRQRHPDHRLRRTRPPRLLRTRSLPRDTATLPLPRRIR